MSDSNALPAGWCQTTLGVIRIDDGKSIEPSKYPDEQFELYSVPSYDTGLPEHLRGDAIGSSKQVVTSRTVLLCKINPRINRAWVVADYYRANRKIASTEWIPFPPVDGVEPWFLAYFLRQSHVRHFLAANASGVGGSLMRVSARTIQQYSLLVPPLAEQQRIVAAIEEQFTRLDAGVAALKRAQAALKRYRAAVLKAAVEGKLTAAWRSQHPDVWPASELLADILAERRARWEAELRAKGKDPAKMRYEEPQSPPTEGLPGLPQGWVWATFTQVSQRVTVGHVGSMKDEYVEDGIPFLRGQNVRPNCFDPNGLKYISRTFHDQLAKSKLRPGDILVVRSGAVGTACVLPDTVPEANCSDLVIVQQPLLISGQFAAYYMNSAAQDTVRAQKVGIALEHFNTQSLAVLPLPLPPLPEQEQIVAEAERRLSVVDALELTIAANLKRAERLRQAILERAFTGRLVPQDPNDEPASALLERIRTEQESDRRPERAGRRVGAAGDAQPPPETAQPATRMAQNPLW